MPDGIVGPGGSRGVQEIGADFNASMTNKIISIGEGLAAENITAAKSEQYIEGRAFVAAGGTHQEIKDNQGVFDSIFGVATLEGAKAQTVVQAADQHVKHMQDNMHQYKSLSTEEFIAGQREYVTDTLLTGDTSLDNLITIASADAIADATKLHTKQRALYKQQAQKVEYESTLMGASERMHSALNNESIALSDRLSSAVALQQRMQPSYGQTEEAHRNSVFDSLVTELKKDRSSLYNLAVNGELDLGDGTPFSAVPMKFDAVQTQTINEAYAKHQGRVDINTKMLDAQTVASLQAASENPTVTPTELTGIIQSALEARGAGLMTTLGIAGLYNKKVANDTKDVETKERVKSIIQGKTSINTSPSETASDLSLAETAMDEMVRGMPPEQQEQASVNAVRVITDAAINHNVVPSTWASQWNAGLATPIVDGKVSETYLETLQHFNSKYEADKQLFGSSLDSKTLAHALGVKHLLATTNIEPEEAVRQMDAYSIPISEASAYVLHSKDYQSRIKKFVADPDNVWWIPDVLSKWPELENKLQASKEIAQYVSHTVAETGNTGVGAWKAATHRWLESHEPVQGRSVFNKGVALKQQAGIVDPAVDFDDAYDYYLNRRGPEIFGAGFDPANTRLRVDGDFLQITPVNPDGTFLPGLENSSRRIPITEIGATFNTEVTDDMFKQAITSASYLDDASTLLNKGSLTNFMQSPQDAWLEVTAAHGASRYNASTEQEQTAWKRNAVNRYTKLQIGDVSTEAKENVADLEDTLDSVQDVFSAELQSTGISMLDLKKAMTLVYAAETNFGTHPTKVSPTGVVGELQVTTDTFKDLVTQGILGDKAAQALGFNSRTELASLSNSEIRGLLSSKKGSFIAGTGKYLQTLM